MGSFGSCWELRNNEFLADLALECLPWWWGGRGEEGVKNAACTEIFVGLDTVEVLKTRGVSPPVNLIFFTGLRSILLAFLVSLKNPSCSR